MRIILGVTGSIAAYKAADLANSFTKEGHEVHVIMSKAATEFITPMTLQVLSKNYVNTDVMVEPDPQRIEHIDLVKEADVLLIAPATANIIGKIANGIADEIVSTVALAGHELKKYIAPAMNTRMYENPVMQENLLKLEKLGYTIIEPRSTLLACRDVGKGAMATVETILAEVM
ncbi:phosphopantothenoylcysteine decarboxylase [Erysipelothrix larvae]|uniref:Phosphopantothenoylcysteine decarboxylase n=1 Tax=Erysipelothrix larvae TaxID=1514105 RepID=A0A0X8H1H7_9FIRM|nr:phosphopantothenoylcysteine decarboxylase [Erysipelothrix larvae]AMC94295.1 phosphopantothenoylcysteine decarboxylase [Erysipelothrix larvae]